MHRACREAVRHARTLPRPWPFTICAVSFPARTRSAARRIQAPVDPELESTCAVPARIARRRPGAADGAAQRTSAHPLLGNLFGHRDRIEAALAGRPLAILRELGELLAAIKEPRWPSSLKQALSTWPELAQLAHVAPQTRARCRVQPRDPRRRRRRPRAAADPALLAGRRRQAGHLRPGDHPRHAQAAAERRDLPDAGDRPQPRDHALAAAPRRRARLRRLAGRASGRTLPGAGRDRRRSGDDAGRGRAGARHPVRIRIRRPAARPAHARVAQRADRADAPAGAEIAVGRFHPARRHARWKGRSATTPATTTPPTTSRC